MILTEQVAQLTQENQQLQQQLLALQNNLTAVEASLEKSQQQNRWLKEQIHLHRRQQFGRSSEKSQYNLSLFDDNEADEVTAQEQDNPDNPELINVKYTRRRRNVKRVDLSHLPTEERVHDVDEAAKTCACGQVCHKIGEDRKEELDYIPAQYKRIVHVWPKYACRACETIQSAPKKERALGKCLASNALAIDTVIKKYDNHLPLYRQAQIHAQDGLPIPDNTLGLWVMKTAEALVPLGDALWRIMTQSDYLQVDETPVKLLKPEQKAYMWLYHNTQPDKRCVIFDFQLGRGSEYPNTQLADFKGLLQTDGYGGYNALQDQPAITALGCFDHARRYVKNAVNVAPKTKGIAHELLKLINRLYKIEREIKHENNDTRYQQRQEKAKPILDELFKRVKAANPPPKSTLGKAITYLTNQEAHLRAYIHHGKAHMSNCLAENLIRPFAIGRKNWMFVGNELSAQRSALLYSLIQSCKLNNINPRQYLLAVLELAPQMRKQHIDPIRYLPHNIDRQLLIT